MKRVPLTRAQRLLFGAVVAGVLLAVFCFLIPRSVWWSPLGILLAAAVLVVAWLASLSSDIHTAPSDLRQTGQTSLDSGSRAAIARRVLWRAIFWIVMLILVYAVVHISSNGT
jgi:hypothetical protein